MQYNKNMDARAGNCDVSSCIIILVLWLVQELGTKQWCILYVALLIALGTGMAVGVPLALRSSSSLHDRLSTAHNILAQVPLIDG